MSLTDEIKKTLNNQICEEDNGRAFEDKIEGGVKTNEDKYIPYYTIAKNTEIVDQLYRLIDLVNNTNSDYISIDIKLKTLTSKQRYKHKGDKMKFGPFN